MSFFELSQGTVHEGTKQLAPDIPEQLEIAKRIDSFLQAVFINGVEPAQKTRVIKDYRSPQPGGGIAHVSVGYSDTLEGQYMSEVQTNHRQTGVQSHYSLLPDGEHWMRTSKTTHGTLQGQTVLSPYHMLEDMIEYAPENGAVADLFDKIATTRALVSALFSDMNRGAHYKSGSDYYRTVVPSYTSDGSYTSARKIELIDGRVNNRIRRRLSVTAITNYGQGPIDIAQQLVYGVEVTKNGSIKSDGIQLIHASSDGLTPQTLANLAESSDVVYSRIDILHKALDDLSSDKLSAS